MQTAVNHNLISTNLARTLDPIALLNKTCGALLRRTGEDTCPYVVTA